eukprot:m.289488 g.289488  ORF g.289488 m.289488 type:complete len:383 (+) comp12141_c0_seq1:248-1396(+)
MGRKKIAIERIANDRNRQVTLNKRRGGLFKKAYELSVLCDCEVAVVIFDRKGNLFEYSSHSIAPLLEKVRQAGAPTEAHNNKSMRDSIQRKTKGGNSHSEDDDDDEEDVAPQPLTSAAPAASLRKRPAPLTPNTQRTIDEVNQQYARMVQSIKFPGDPANSATAAVANIPSIAVDNASPGPDSFAAAAAAVQARPPMPLRTRSDSASSGGNKMRKRPDLSLHIPNSDKPFPSGTKPRQPNASTANALPSLSSILSPNIQFVSTTPLLQMSPYPSPSALGWPGPWGSTNGAISPAVLTHSAAGDLHMSNSAQLALQNSFGLALTQQQQHQQQVQQQQQHQGPTQPIQFFAPFLAPMRVDESDKAGDGGDASATEGDAKRRRIA